MSRGWRGLWADALATDNGRRQWSPSGPLARRIRVQIEVLLLLPLPFMKSSFHSSKRKKILSISNRIETVYFMVWIDSIL
jgi:hypothetical protein